MKEITLSLLSEEGTFLPLYEKMQKRIPLDEAEKVAILRLSVVLLNYGDVYVKQLAYRLVMQYSNLHKDFIPLHSIAEYEGYTPVVQYIEDNFGGMYGVDKHFFGLYSSSYREMFREGKAYLTEQQVRMGTDFAKNSDKSYAVVAPTSYGKSELIISTINSHQTANICILVPTKALLAQTKQRVLNSLVNGEKRKIITHPEMYLPGDDKFVAILTQERLLRLLQKQQSLTFSLVFVDEAHNLLENNSRSILLAMAIAILSKRNSNTVFKFLSPFLLNISSLRVSHSGYTIDGLKINEHIKVEKYFTCDLRKDNRLEIYDQFLDKFISTEDGGYSDGVNVVLNKLGRKNIIYSNSPRKIVKIAGDLAGRSQPIKSERIKKACEDMAKYLHKDYDMIQCISHGVIYHHGSVPDNIRLYVEHLFSEELEIPHIVTSSTLLEGVNIPAEKLFLFDYKKGTHNLSASQFKNLVGRICRFREIFNPKYGNMQMLEPEVYIVGCAYSPGRTNINRYLQGVARVGAPIIEKSENVLLQNTEIAEGNKIKKERADEFAENIEPGLIDSPHIKHAKTEIGKSCFANNITEINIIAEEEKLNRKVARIKDARIVAQTVIDVVGLVAYLFIDHMSEGENFELKRLSESKAREFYAMFLRWRVEGTSYSEMIASFLHYWAKRVKSEEGEVLVYVGKWGDRSNDSGFKNLWVDMRQKSKREQVNLAVVRIKEEQDFLDYKLIRFVEVLNDFSFIEPKLYEAIKYGTSDPKMIVLIKSGFSFGLAALLLKKYSSFLKISLEHSTVSITRDIVDEMQSNDENAVLIYEATLNVKMA